MSKTLTYEGSMQDSVDVALSILLEDMIVDAPFDDGYDEFVRNEQSDVASAFGY